MKHTPRIAVNYVIFTFLFAICAIFVSRGAVETYHDTPTSAQVSESDSRVVFVIDPGHGGEDGGTSGGELVEKDLNLSVSRALSQLCTLFGYEHAITREDDRLLYDMYGDLTDYTGHKKSYDLKNRLRFSNERDPALFIGIHMNAFPDQKYRGLQVYYSPNDGSSKDAAELIRAYSKKYADSENERAIKSAGQSIFILKRIETPAVLVECGFLSNEVDRARLGTAEYQAKLASVIFAASAEFVSGS